MGKNPAVVVVVAVVGHVAETIADSSSVDSWRRNLKKGGMESQVVVGGRGVGSAQDRAV